MAYYNPYNTINPPGFNPQPSYSTTQNYIPTPQMPEQHENGILWVQGEAGAKSFAVAPGRSVMLMDSEQDRFYIKTADASGMPMPLRIFEYKEVTQTDISAQPTTDYVTREEFTALSERLNELVKKTTKKEK